MSGVRRALRTVLAGAAATVFLITSAAAPQARADNLEDAKDKVERLQREASEVGEDYEEATVALENGRKKLTLLRKDIATQEKKVDALADQARQVALLQFQGRNVDTTVALFVDSDPDTFLDRLVTTTAVGVNMDSTLSEYATAQADLLALQRSAEADVAALDTEQQRLTTLKTSLDTKVKEAETVVATLTEAARQALYARSGVRTSFDISELDEAGVSEKIRKVVAYATSKVGKAQYVWGASGPSGYDCSGLMLAAYRTVGVSLPHSSRSQFGIGRSVSRGDLQPGDLIFWYSPVHHVGMYIGNGKIVHARNVRDDLVIQSLASYPAPYSGARRVLG